MSDTTPIAGLWADSEAWSVAEPTESTRAGDLDLLRKSGLVDGDYYGSTYLISPPAASIRQSTF